MWLLAAYRQPTGSLQHSQGRLAWAEVPLGAVPYSSYEPGKLSKWLCYDDSTINIIIIIIIIIITVWSICVVQRQQQQSTAVYKY